MHSSLLEANGVRNHIAGAGYNFRYQKAGKEVIEDVEKALNVRDIQPKEIYTGQQVHGVRIEYADGMNGEPFAFGRTFKETDGLITDKPGIALLIKFADCTPVVLYDPIKKVLASIHSGWRGAAQQIPLHAIEKMENKFDCNREDLLIYVGPSIDQGNYEVGPEVYEAFATVRRRERFFLPKEDKFLMNMQGANLQVLREAGIQEHQLEVERASTYMDSRLHSARKEGPEYQLNGIITMIEE